MTRRWAVAAAMPAAVASIAVATLGASAGSSAGKPQADTRLLCGTWTWATADNQSGNSSIDHPSGSAATGHEITNATAGQKCGDSDFSGNPMFTWTVGHSNVNVNSQKGTEHGAMTFTDASGNATGNPVTKFNGRISIYDPSDSNGDLIYYASSGRFNTLGGAENGVHFFGSYSTLVYQTSGDSNSPCDKTMHPMTYCFQATVAGKTN